LNQTKEGKIIFIFSLSQIIFERSVVETILRRRVDIEVVWIGKYPQKLLKKRYAVVSVSNSFEHLEMYSN